MPFEEKKRLGGLKTAIIIIVLLAAIELVFFAVSRIKDKPGSDYTGTSGYTAEIRNTPASASEAALPQEEASAPSPVPSDEESAYSAAAKLMEDGRYEDAIEAFEQLHGYGDSAAMIIECRAKLLDLQYENALALFAADDYRAAREAFLLMGDYKDCPQLSADCERGISRNDALACMQKGSWDEALALLESAGDFKDCPQLLLQCRYEMLQPGDSLIMGTYEQDNNTENGREDIEWFILDKQDGKVLVLSRCALDVRLYHIRDAEVTWETCTMREWLNGDFYNESFTDEERALIPLSTVTADPNPQFPTPAGNDTEDYIFLLSIDEVERYFENQSDRVCAPTAYARARGAGVYENRSVWWWLRSPGMDNRDGALVGVVGQINCVGFYEIEFGFCARPAMWVQICE